MKITNKITIIIQIWARRALVRMVLLLYEILNRVLDESVNLNEAIKLEG